MRERRATESYYTRSLRFGDFIQCSAVQCSMVGTFRECLRIYRLLEDMHAMTFRESYLAERLSTSLRFVPDKASVQSVVAAAADRCHLHLSAEARGNGKGKHPVGV